MSLVIGSCWVIVPVSLEEKLEVHPDAALHVVVTLSVAAQVDGVRVHVDVHQVVLDLALDVVLHPVHQETPAHVYHLDKRQVPAGGDGSWGAEL